MHTGTRVPGTAKVYRVCIPVYKLYQCNCEFIFIVIINNNNKEFFLFLLFSIFLLLLMAKKLNGTWEILCNEFGLQKMASEHRRWGCAAAIYRAALVPWVEAMKKIIANIVIQVWHLQSHGFARYSQCRCSRWQKGCVADIDDMQTKALWPSARVKPPEHLLKETLGSFGSHQTATCSPSQWHSAINGNLLRFPSIQLSMQSCILRHSSIRTRLEIPLQKS